MIAPAVSDIQARQSLDPSWRAVIDEALVIRDAQDVPFWDALISLCSTREIPPALRREALYHNASGGRAWDLVPSDDLGDLLRRRANRLAVGEVLALSSEVQCEDAGRMQIPMLDFRWEPTPENQHIIEAMLGDLGVPGLLADSGNSFHFFGAELLGIQETVRFLGLALLCGPMVDRRWIAHQLIEGSCALRISSRDPRGRPESEPTVVGVVRP